jgi:hypothetical protein
MEKLRLEEVEGWTILRSEVGSTVHGIGIDGTDDRDEMGVCVEPPEYVIGCRSFEQLVFRTKPDGERSGPGDLDLVIYSLRKYCRLALRGNPTILLPLFTSGKAVMVCTEDGNGLKDIRQAFFSKLAGKAFYHYLTAQLERLKGSRGQMRVTRRELIEAHGYDTKYAGHALRLGYQGLHYLGTAHIEVPMLKKQRERIISIRRGEIPFAEVLTEIEEVRNRLGKATERDMVPNEPDTERVEKFLVKTYKDAWKV